MSSYYIWTIGCQMNKADSESLSTALNKAGLSAAPNASQADVVVLNSCVVRQSAEDKVVGNLGMMKSVKAKKPGQILALMGCMVGARTEDLERRFPQVDLFMRPQQFSPILDLLEERLGIDTEGCLSAVAPASPSVSSYVPVIHGCDLMCTFCIIPFRRGRQVSRPVEEITHQVDLMTRRGMKEVTLLGQTVDAYGHDFDEPCDLSRLLHAVHSVEGLERLRFLTSHPIFMSQDIIDAVAQLPKVCEHINLPFQAGDDQVLEAMRRRYTQGQYRELVDRIRRTVPDVAISTDVIVGFPGETREQFMETYNLVEDVGFDKVHMAAYSPRPGTFAHRRLPDSVSLEEKQHRLKALESLQKDIQEKKNRRIVGATEEVLVEGRKKGRWQGRTRQDKLVFFEHPSDMLGRTVEVKIEAATAWSLRGTPAKSRQPSHAGVSP